MAKKKNDKKDVGEHEIRWSCIIWKLLRNNGEVHFIFNQNHIIFVDQSYKTIVIHFIFVHKILMRLIMIIIIVMQFLK